MESTNHPGPPEGNDIAWLREEFPGWDFGSVWFTNASGPDRRSLFAVNDEILPSAWSAGDLAAKIREYESG